MNINVITWLSKNKLEALPRTNCRYNTNGRLPIIIKSTHIYSNFALSKNAKESVLKMSIDDLEFSARSANCLKRAGIETVAELIEKDLEQNTEFRIKYPRGQLGKSSGEAELYMLVEDLYKSVDRLNKAIEDGMHNKVNIEFLQKQVEKATHDIEKLKDRQREFANGHKEK